MYIFLFDPPPILGILVLKCALKANVIKVGFKANFVPGEVIVLLVGPPGLVPLLVCVGLQVHIHVLIGLVGPLPAGVVGSPGCRSPAPRRSKSTPGSAGAGSVG